jgi:hypothetical protein
MDKILTGLRTGDVLESVPLMSQMSKEEIVLIVESIAPTVVGLHAYYYGISLGNTSAEVTAPIEGGQ